MAGQLEGPRGGREPSTVTAVRPSHGLGGATLRAPIDSLSSTIVTEAGNPGRGTLPRSLSPGYEAIAVAANRLGGGGVLEEAGELIEIDPRQETAAVCREVVFAPEYEH